MRNTSMLTIQVVAIAFVLMSLAVVYAQPPSAPPSASTDAELILAASEGNVWQVELLLQKGANINATNKQGFTPLFMAAGKGQRDTVMLLLDKGADVNLRNKYNGATGLIIAAEEGHSEIVAALLNKGANINATANNGYTALMIAVQAGKKDAAQTLVAHGADVNMVARNGWAALAIAEEKGYEEIAKLLRTSGAEGYRPIANYPSRLDFRIQTEEIWFADGGKKMTGTLKSLTCEEKDIELKSKSIDSGYVDTVRYGKLRIGPPQTLGTSVLLLSITPDQEKAFLKLRDTH